MCSAVTRSHRFSVGESDRALLGHVCSHLESCAPCSLPHPGLEHPELVLLDRELGVAHVAVVVLEAAEYPHELFVDRREMPLHLGEWLCVADTGDHVLALCVHEEVAVLTFLAGCRVTCETDASPRALVAVAEHHRLNVHRGPEIVRDALTHSVCDWRAPFHDRKTASIAPLSWSSGSWGKGLPVWRRTICLYEPVR